MPKAQRRNTGPGAASSVSASDGREQAVADPTPVTPAPDPPPDLRSSLDLWHKRISYMAGSMVLCYGKTGIKRNDLRGWVLELRHLADSIERFT
jgi:hypothetical protein